MKKLKLFALGLLGASMFITTSCEDDPEEDAIGPILTVTASPNSISDGEVEVTPGSTVTFEWEARKGDADLDRFEIIRDGDAIVVTTEKDIELPYDPITNADDEIYADSYQVTVSDSPGSASYEFKVTDKDGLTKTVEVTVIIADEETPLTTEEFEWRREGSNDGTGLSQFGLEWTQNTSTNAIIATDGAQMVLLDSQAWTSITTLESLMANFTEGTVIERYEGVSSEDGGTYDDVLAVEYGGEHYLIHVTDGEVSTAGEGTTIIISGEYKHAE